MVEVVIVVPEGIPVVELMDVVNELVPKEPEVIELDIMEVEFKDKDPDDTGILVETLSDEVTLESVTEVTELVEEVELPVELEFAVEVFDATATTAAVKPLQPLGIDPTAATYRDCAPVPFEQK